MKKRVYAIHIHELKKLDSHFQKEPFHLPINFHWVVQSLFSPFFTPISFPNFKHTALASMYPHSCT